MRTFKFSQFVKYLEKNKDKEFDYTRPSVYNCGSHCAMLSFFLDQGVDCFSVNRKGDWAKKIGGIMVAKIEFPEEMEEIYYIHRGVETGREVLNKIKEKNLMPAPEVKSFILRRNGHAFYYKGKYFCCVNGLLRLLPDFYSQPEKLRIVLGKGPFVAEHPEKDAIEPNCLLVNGEIKSVLVEKVSKVVPQLKEPGSKIKFGIHKYK